MLEDLITVSEAAKRSGINGSFIRRLLANGRLRGRKIGNSWAIEPTSLEEYLKTDRKPGRKPLDK